MITKSVRLTELEAGELREFTEAVGEVEAAVVKRALLRGLQDLRIERAILAYLAGSSSSEAAELARLPRATFLELLMEKGIAVIDSPPDFSTQLASAASRFGSERLAAVARDLASDEAANRASG
jgi:hypothetical protein